MTLSKRESMMTADHVKLCAEIAEAINRTRVCISDKLSGVVRSKNKNDLFVLFLYDFFGIRVDL